MSRASVSLRHTHLSALCHRYPDGPPILAFWTESLDVTVTAEPDSDGGSVAELLTAIAQYAAALAEWQQRQEERSCGRPAVTP